VRAARYSFDIFSLYRVKTSFHGMHERDWLRRVIFLETVAGVPGMVAGMCRHLHSLRLMRRDHGWIHSLLAEAENERMHLLIALQIRRPGKLFHLSVIGTQFVFLTAYTIAYLLCPRFCHRFVGYLEEEAVYTYTKLISEIDNGNLPMFANMRAPKFACTYYNLPSNAMLREVFECIRADEGAHRDANHHFSALKSDEPNTMVEHLTKGHFQNQGAFTGVALVVSKVKEQALLAEFKAIDLDSSGYINPTELKKGLKDRGVDMTDKEVDEIIGAADTDNDGKLNYEEFVNMMHSDDGAHLGHK